MSRRQQKPNVQLAQEEEKARGLEEIITMLLEGGYYRARISAIDIFDKVAGGLAWCILCSRESIDVEFKENANIGEKLKLGENIENALVAMQCPFELQTYQIQGLDLPKLIPVIQWLLKRVASVRREQQASINRHASLLFGRTFGAFPGEDDAKPTVVVPTRKLRRRADEDISTEASYVNSVLLEYGDTYQVRTDVDMADADEEDDVRAKEQLIKMKEEEERELQAMQEMMSNMSSMKERSKLSATAVGGLLSHQSEEIAQAAADYDDKMTLLREESAKGDADLQALFSKKATLDQQLGEQQEVLLEVQARHERVARETEKASKDVGKKQRRLQRITDEIQRIQAELDEDPTRKTLFNKLMKHIKRAESAEEEVESLRNTCYEDMQSWKKKIERMKEKAADAHARGTDEVEMETLMEQIAHTKGKFDPFRKVSAELDRVLAGLNRQIDAVPTRAELVQYEKRFSELYEQASWKYAETELSYNRYNMLTEKVRYLQKEKDLMKSIETQCTEVLNPKEPAERKTELAQNIHGIVEKVELSKDNVVSELQVEKMKLEVKTSDYTVLIEAHRNYLQCIKDLEEEFEQNQKLTSKITSLQAAVTEAE